MKVALLGKKLQSETLHSAESVRVALSGASESEAVPALLEIAENEEQKRRVLKIVRGLMIATWIVASALWMLAFVWYYRRWFNLITPMQVFVPNLIMVCTSAETHLKRLHNAVVALLQLPYEPRCLHPMIDALNLTQTPELKNVLYLELTERLWDLPAPDAALLLDEARRATLRRVLSHLYSIMPNGKREVRPGGRFDAATADLAVAVIKTLAAIGDRKSATVLQKIIKSHSLLPNETVVRDAAREFLPILQKRIEENEKIYEYLRTLVGKAPHASYAAIAEYVDTLAAQDVRPVLAEFLMEQNRRTVRSRWLSGGGLLVVFATLALACSSLIRYPSWIGVAFVVFAALISRCMRILWRPHSEVGAGKIAYELAKRSGDDTRVLPILLRARQKPLDKKQADAVQKAVLHLLPLLRAGDAALVPPTLRPLLRAWLTMPRGALGRAAKSKAVVALAALAAIGDTDALRRVEAVIRYAETVRRGDTLRQSAARCRDALQSRKPF